MEAIAKTKYLKGSPQKARLVIDLVRGKNVSQALAILKFTNKRAATPIAKCIRSAVANATYSAEQQNIAIDPDDLWVKTCFVDMGPTKNRRRLRPAPQGRAYQERRHFCHITIMLTSDVPEGAEEEPKPRKRGKKVMAKKAADEAKMAKAEAKKESPKKASELKDKDSVKTEEADTQKAPASEVEGKTEKKDTPKPKAEKKAEPKKEEKNKEDAAEEKPGGKKEEDSNADEQKKDPPKTEEKTETNDKDETNKQ